MLRSGAVGQHSRPDFVIDCSPAISVQDRNVLMDTLIDNSVAGLQVKQPVLAG